MTHEAARRSVSRLWLRAFAGIVAVLVAPVLVRAEAVGEIASTNLLPEAVFSRAANGRAPRGVFVTDLGVYELDTKGKSVRIWQRSEAGLEMLRPKDGSAFVPYTEVQIEATPASRRPQRFFGVDAAGDGIPFKQPVGIDKHPTENRFAVVSAGEFISQGDNQYSPSIQVYDFVETAGEDGALASVEVTLAGTWDKAFHETTNDWRQVVEHVYSYRGVEYCTTNANPDGTTSEWYYGTRRAPLTWTDAEGNVLVYGPPREDPVRIDGPDGRTVTYFARVVSRGRMGGAAVVEFANKEFSVEGEIVEIEAPTSLVRNGVLYEFRAYPETTTVLPGAGGATYTVCGYPGTVAQVLFDAAGDCFGFRTSDLVSFETELLDRTITTNWIWVIADTPKLVCQTNQTSQTGLKDPVFVDLRNPTNFVAGLEFTYLSTNDWVSVTTNYFTLTNYVFRYETTTNASYLATATDVAFLGGDGLVASITAEDYQTVRSGFVVFGADPASGAKVFPVADQTAPVSGIGVDKETGDIYAAVPGAAAVFRYPSPGGSPASWASLADRTPVFHDDYSAGVTNVSGSAFGSLSNPDDASVWHPDDGSPILLVADTANGRVHAFATDCTDWPTTNWLGTVFNADALSWTVTNNWPSYIRPEDVSFVETTTTNIVRRRTGDPLGFQYELVPVIAVETNYYWLGRTAFPLFTIGSGGAFNNPRGVYGQDGSQTVAVADAQAQRVSLFSVPLAALESDEILAMAVYWPTGESGWAGIADRDLAVTNGSAGGSVAWWDATVPDVAPAGTLVVRECDGYANEFRFSVAPARTDRTFTLSVSGGSGVVPVQGTATVPAGATEGVLTFEAKDGAVAFEESVSCRDRYGNAVTNGDPKAVSAVTNRIATTPVYTLEVSSGGGFSTNATLVVANVNPVITNAAMYGVIVPDDPPYVMVQGLAVNARDWVEADADLQYLWWATTNVNWGVNNLFWAVTNNEWAAGAVANWSAGPVFEAAQRATASAITGETQSGLVTNTIELLVASGNEIPLPYGYDSLGLYAGTEPGTAPFLVVCTVLDKDGGAAIIPFPTPSEPAGTADRWSYGGESGGGGGEESDAVYSVRFTEVSGEHVSFEVSLVSGTPLRTDYLVLETATFLAGPWTTLRNVTVGQAILASGSSATFRVSPAGTGEVRFYRVSKP